MSIVIIFNQKDPTAWHEKLSRSLPNTQIYVHPEIDHADDITFALCWKPDPGVLDQYPNLQAAQSAGAGANHVTNTQNTDNIQVSRIVDQHLSNDMFEYALAAVLADMKRLSTFKSQQQDKSWIKQSYKTIAQTSIGILGAGEIGSVMAEKMQLLGFKTSVWSRSKKVIPHVESLIGEDGLNVLLEQSDYLINVLPHTSATENLMNLDFFNRIKRGAYLINIGRGQCLVEKDLITAIEAGQLSGATLDVFQKEPLDPAHPFWEMSQIRITPHQAAITNIDSAVELVVDNYRRCVRGEVLRYVVGANTL